MFRWYSTDSQDVGSQFLAQEQFEKAAEKFTIAISAGRVTSELLTKRAWAFISCGRYMDALRDADQAISLDSSNYQVIYMLWKCERHITRRMPTKGLHCVCWLRNASKKVLFLCLVF